MCFFILKHFLEGVLMYVFILKYHLERLLMCVFDLKHTSVGVLRLCAVGVHSSE